MLVCSVLTRFPRRNHITPALGELHWFRIRDKIIFKILISTHKAFHCAASVYLCELITKHENATVRTRRAQCCFFVTVLSISKNHAVSFFKRLFLCAAPTLWNILIIDIIMHEFDQFKPRVKAKLYLKQYEA